MTTNRADIETQAAKLEQQEAQLKIRLWETQQQLKKLPHRPYRPTKEALEYRNRPNKPTLPPPLYGGTAGLHAAAREAASWDVTHRRGPIQHQNAA